MGLDREHGMVAFGEVARTEPDKCEKLVDRAIEKHLIVGDIHVAVVVDPLRFNRHHPRADRRLGEGNGGLAVKTAGIGLSLAHNRQFDTLMDEEQSRRFRAVS